jgi:hypothetical protein
MPIQEILNSRLVPFKNYLVFFYRILRRPTWFKEPFSTNTKWEDYAGYPSPIWWKYVVLCSLISTSIFGCGQVNGISVIPGWVILHQWISWLFVKGSLEALVKFIDEYLIISAPFSTLVMLAFFGFSTPLIHMVMRMTEKQGSLRCLFKVTIANTATWCVVQSIPVVFWVFAFRFGSVQNKIWLTSTTYAAILAFWYQAIAFILMFYLFRAIQSVYHVSPRHALIGMAGGYITIVLFAIGLLLSMGFFFWFFYIPLIVWFILSPFLSQVYQKIVIFWNQYKDIFYLKVIGFCMLILVLSFCFALAFCIRQSIDERRFSALTILFRKPPRWLFWIIFYVIFVMVFTILLAWIEYKTSFTLNTPQR